jgi:hypothetical protein
MTDIGRSTHRLPAAALSPASLGRRFDDSLDALIEALTRWLCRASRGYLCPPDMTSVMYPDEPGTVDSRTNSRSKECCDENLPGK